MFSGQTYQVAKKKLWAQVKSSGTQTDVPVNVECAGKKDGLVVILSMSLSYVIGEVQKG